MDFGLRLDQECFKLITGNIGQQGFTSYHMCYIHPIRSLKGRLNEKVEPLTVLASHSNEFVTGVL